MFLKKIHTDSTLCFLWIICTQTGNYDSHTDKSILIRILNKEKVFRLSFDVKSTQCLEETTHLKIWCKKKKEKEDKRRGNTRYINWLKTGFLSLF